MHHYFSHEPQTEPFHLVRTLRVLGRLDAKRERQSFMKGAAAVYCTAVLGRFDNLAGTLERGLEAGVHFTPRQLACVLRVLRRLLRQHYSLAFYTALDP